MFTGVCLSTGEGEVPGQYLPGPGTPLGTRYTAPGTKYTPPGAGTTPHQTRYTPGTRYTPRHQVHPLGPGTHTPGTRYTPGAMHARRYGQQAGGTHPTGMHSCLKEFHT